MTLYELEGQWLELMEMAEDPDTEPEVFADTLEALEGELEAKADGYAMVLRQMKADSETCREEERRLAARRKSIDGRMEKMKESLMDMMRLTGKPKFRTERFSYSIAKNPPSLALDVPVEELPEEFRIPQPDKPDSAAIAERLKAGEVLPFAHLEQGTHLNIR